MTPTERAVLRDHFAGLALLALIVASGEYQPDEEVPGWGGKRSEHMARDAYRFADAMLEARKPTRK